MGDIDKETEITPELQCALCKANMGHSLKSPKFFVVCLSTLVIISIGTVRLSMMWKVMLYIMTSRTFSTKATEIMAFVGFTTFDIFAITIWGVTIIVYSLGQSLELAVARANITMAMELRGGATINKSI